MIFMGKYVIKGIFGPIKENDKLKTVFQDSELQEFIKSKIGKNKNIFDNKFGFVKFSKNGLYTSAEPYGNAVYMLTSSSIETKSGVAYEAYLYLDKNGNAYRLEIESATSARSTYIDV
jgi:hypothetical protein